MRILALTLTLTFSYSASAIFQTELLRGKRSRGDSSVHWTLADWLTQKNGSRLMDQWLALNSSGEWFEFNVSGNAQEFKVKTDNGTTQVSKNQRGENYEVDIYLSILNLNGEYRKTDDDRESFGGAAGFRLLGSNSQSTNLVARYGWRKLIDLSQPEHWEQQYAEGSLQLYVIEDFGIRGTYRYYFPADSDRGTRLQGHRVTAGAFLEFMIFRIYADYFQEPMEVSSQGVVTQRSEDGFQGGLKLFF